MTPHLPTFIFVAVNLLILYIALKKILFKPVTEFMEKREKSIRDAIDDADKNKAAAKELKSKYELQLQDANTQADSVLKEARDRGGREYEAIISQAREEAQGILEKAREEIERERAQMLRDVRSQVASLALAAASKVLESNVDTESNRALVDKFIDEAGAA